MTTAKPRKVADMKDENRFASRMKDARHVTVIDPDVAKVFTTSEQVNKTLPRLPSAGLRALISRCWKSKSKVNETVP